MLPKASPDAVIPPAGVDVEAAKAAITACRHAILADLLAVERMMRSLDSRVDVAEYGGTRYHVNKPSWLFF